MTGDVNSYYKGFLICQARGSKRDQQRNARNEKLPPFHQWDASMIYELRVYTAMPGRLPDVLARFRDHTVEIWNGLGIRQLGYWTTAIGPDSNALTYMLVWDSMADREAKWGKFVTDSEWVRARTASEASGPIVAKMDSSFLTPTSFSPLK